MRMLQNSYHTVLPAANRIPCKNLAFYRSLRARVERLFREGFWFCSDCDGRCERIESDQGQPAKCSKCGSVRIDWIQPLREAIPADKIIEPQDFAELAGKEAAL